MALTRKVLAASAIAAFVAFPIPGVFAQSSSSTSDNGSAASAPPSEGAPAAESAQPAQGASAQVDDATLQKAAKAYVKVKQIVHQTKQTQSDGSGAQPDQSASQSEKIAAVKNEGLDPEQYNQVIQMVQNDPGLQQKFANYVNQNGGDTD